MCQTADRQVKYNVRNRSLSPNDQLYQLAYLTKPLITSKVIKKKGDALKGQGILLHITIFNISISFDEITLWFQR